MENEQCHADRFYPAESVETNAYFPSKISHKDRKITWIINCSGYTNVEKAEALTQAAETLTQQIATSLKIAEKNLADSKVYAPYSGYIVSKTVNT